MGILCISLDAQIRETVSSALQVLGPVDLDPSSACGLEKFGATPRNVVIFDRLSGSANLAKALASFRQRRAGVRLLAWTMLNMCSHRVPALESVAALHA